MRLARRSGDPQSEDVREAYALARMLAIAVFISYLDRTNISVGALAMQVRFDWSETQKGAVLSAFYLGYLPLTIISGLIVNRVGGRLVLVGAVIWWSVFTALTPWAASVSLPILCLSRVAIGLGEAAVFPAAFNLIAENMSSTHRTRAVVLVTSSTALGTIVGLIASGWLMRAFDWPMAFYAFSVLGFIWVALWRFSAPVAAPVEKSIAPANAGLPWPLLVRSPPVWAVVCAHFCYNWCVYVLVAWMPSFFKATFAVSATTAGILSAAPWLALFVTANLAASLADRCIVRKVRVVVVRKAAQTIGLSGAGFLLLMLASPNSITTAVAMMCVAMGLLGLCQAGFAPNFLEIAPHHADVLFGCSNAVATLPGLFGVYLTGWLVDLSGSYSIALYATAGIALAGALMFGVLASDKPLACLPAPIRQAQWADRAS